MIYGYSRVSTGAQDLTSQLARLKAAGCAKIVRGKVTGTTADRPQLRKLIAVLKRGDVTTTVLRVVEILRPHLWVNDPAFEGSHAGRSPPSPGHV